MESRKEYYLYTQKRAKETLGKLEISIEKAAVFSIDVKEELEKLREELLAVLGTIEKILEVL